MGRRAKAPEQAPARNHSLLGWGIFLSILLGFFAPRLGMSINASIALAGTGLVVFVLTWFLGSAKSSSRSGT
ncbi:hypothetical protein CQ018_17940 [Arthrobacter sp. MYb227]|uniref:hypothetical protein n=1 Tax=Arthrobacter sp. MYb227 TaxID=1848601 RepID=UPI000CFCFEC7|nr:hypothetical protein [Arthrobacter sp. MYb227]PQZ87336.1 hypothetical protein CQ018_17940 [Arthrobacter sp. MYb227]